MNIGASLAEQSELLMLVLLGSAIACYIAALSVRTLRRSIARLFLSMAAILVTATWLTSEPFKNLTQELQYGSGFIILLGLGLFAWLIRLPSLNPGKINVGLAHAQFRFYKVATYSNHFQVLTPDSPINLEYAEREKAHLCFGFDKGTENDGIPLTNMRLWLFLKEDSGIKVEVQKTTDNNPYHEWKHYRDTEYFYDFEKPMNQTKTNTWNCLDMTFSNHGDYELKFMITAEGIAEITRYASVRVRPPINPKAQ